MKDEVKEILDSIKYSIDEDDWFEIEGHFLKPFLDYITNLRTIEQQYSAVLSENAELVNKITNLQEELNNQIEIANNRYVEITKLQEELEDLRESDWAWHQTLRAQNKREYRSKFLKEFQEEFGTNTFPDYDEIYKRYDKLKKENERLLYIAKKMHTYIFLNTDNEQEAYDKLGLTEEENTMLGYSGQIIIKGDEDNE